MATNNQNEERTDNGTSGQPTRGKGSSNPKKPNKKARGQKGEKKKKGFNGHALSTSAMYGVTLTHGRNLATQWKFFMNKMRHTANTSRIGKVGSSIESFTFVTEEDFVTAKMDHSLFSKMKKILVEKVWVDDVVITNKIKQAQEAQRWGIQYKQQLHNYELYRELMYKYFFMVLGQCDGQVTTAIESHKDWKKAEEEKDPCKLLIILRSICNGGLTEQNADVIVKSIQAIKRAFNLHQNQTSSSDYEKALTGNIESIISQDQDLFLGWQVWKMAMEQLSLAAADVNDYYELDQDAKAKVRKRVTELIVSQLLVMHGKNSYLRDRCSENQAMGHHKSYEDDPKKVVAMLDTIQPPSKNHKNTNNDKSNEKDKTADTTATKKQVGLHICKEATSFAGSDDNNTMEDISDTELSTTLDNDDDEEEVSDSTVIDDTAPDDNNDEVEGDPSDACYAQILRESEQKRFAGLAQVRFDDDDSMTQEPPVVVCAHVVRHDTTDVKGDTEDTEDIDNNVIIDGPNASTPNQPVAQSHIPRCRDLPINQDPTDANTIGGDDELPPLPQGINGVVLLHLVVFIATTMFSSIHRSDVKNNARAELDLFDNTKFKLLHLGAVSQYLRVTCSLLGIIGESSGQSTWSISSEWNQRLRIYKCPPIPEKMVESIVEAANMLHQSLYELGFRMLTGLLEEFQQWQPTDVEYLSSRGCEYDKELADMLYQVAVNQQRSLPYGWARSVLVRLDHLSITNIPCLQENGSPGSLCGGINPALIEAGLPPIDRVAVAGIARALNDHNMDFC